MNSLKRFGMLVILSLTLATYAVPADLRNEDGQRYEVKVHDGGTTRNTWIDGNSTTLSICSSCEIEVVGIGRVKVSGSDKVAIKNGKLVKN